MTTTSTQQNNISHTLLETNAIKTPSLQTSNNSQYFVYTENNDVIPVKIYGKHTIKQGYLFHIEGSFSATLLHDIISPYTTCNIFFVVKNICWDGQFSTYNISHNDKTLTIISNSIPTDLLHLPENQINAILYEKNITLIVNSDGQLLSSAYNNQRCAVVSINNDDVNGEIIDNIEYRHTFIKKIAQNELFYQNIKKPNNTQNIYATSDIFLPKQSRQTARIMNKYKTMDTNDKIKTKHLNVLISNNTILIPDYGIAPLSIKILNYYFNIHIIPPTYDVEKYLFISKNKKLPFNGIVLPTSLSPKHNTDSNIKKQINTLFSTNKPILTFGYGSNILAEIINFDLSKAVASSIINSYQIYDNYNNIYIASMLKCNYFNHTPFGFHASFYDQKNHNIIGIENKNIASYTFDCLNNTTYTAKILDRFDKKMNETNRK